jgi:hypothetical protein
VRLGNVVIKCRTVLLAVSVVGARNDIVEWIMMTKQSISGSIMADLLLLSSIIEKSCRWDILEYHCGVMVHTTEGKQERFWITDFIDTLNSLNILFDDGARLPVCLAGGEIWVVMVGVDQPGKSSITFNT